METSPVVPGDVPRFGVFDVLGDAVGSIRRRFGTFVAFNVVFLIALFFSFCLVGCLLATVMGGATAAFGGRPGGEGATTTFGAIVVVYGLLIVFVLAALAFHQAFAIETGADDLRGGAPTFATGLSRAANRVLAHFGANVVRVFLDSLLFCLTAGVVAAILRGTGFEPDPNDPSRGVGTAVERYGFVIAGGYLAQLVWVCGVRSFLGMTGPVLQVEGLGVFDAMRRSARLLAGRRLQFIGLRLIWGFAAVAAMILGYLPIVGLVFGTAASGEPPNPAYMFLLIPFALLFYGLMLMLYTFDSVIEAAFHARLAPRNVPGEHVAQVFR